MSQEKLITLDNLGTFKDKLDVRVNRIVAFNNQNLADNPDVTVTGSTKVQIASFDATKFDSLPSEIYFKIVTDRYKKIDITVNYKDDPGPTSRVEVYPDGVNTFTITNTNNNLASCVIEADAGTYSNMMFCVNQNATYVPYYHSNRQLTHENEDLSTNVSNLQTTISSNGAKNLLPMTLEGVKALNMVGTWSGNAYTYNSVTFTVNTDSDGNVTSITTSGTASANSFLFINNNFVIKKGSYILSGGDILDQYNKYGFYLISSGRVIAKTTTANQSFAIDNIITVSESAIFVISGQDSTGLTFYPMIRLASDTDPTFQPYSKTNLELTDDVRDIDYRLEGNACKNLIDVTLCFKVNNLFLRFPSETITVKKGEIIYFSYNAGSNRQVAYAFTDSNGNTYGDSGWITTERNVLHVSQDGSVYFAFRHNDGSEITINELKNDYKPMVTRIANATYESYYPSNKELKALKSKTFSGTTDTNGNLLLIDNINIVPVFVKCGNEYKAEAYFSSTGVKGHFTNINSSANALLSTAVSGTLYYYEL